MGLRSPYPARIPLSMRPPRGLRAEAGGSCEIFVQPLWFCLAGSYTNMKNRKSVARRHVVGASHNPRTGTAQRPHAQNGTVAPRSPHNLCKASARKRQGLRTITVWRRRKLHGNSTEIARFPYNLCAASVLIYPGLPPRAHTRNRTMLVDNVNTYAVAP